MGFTEEETQTLIKFYLSQNYYMLNLYYSTTKEVLVSYQSQMLKPPQKLVQEAERAVRNADLIYTEVEITEASTGDLIIVFEGNRVRLLLLLKREGLHGFMDEYLEKLFDDFVGAFEYKYRKQLKKFDEEKVSFTGVDEDLSELLDLEQNLPHIAKYVGYEPESKIQEYIYNAAMSFSKVVGYFYLPNLLYLTKEYVVEEARKLSINDPKKAAKLGVDPDNVQFPPDEAFYIAMFQLKKTGMLRAIQIDELSSFSKIKYEAA